MDPLSIGLACTSLITAVTKVSVKINTFVRAVRDARHDLDAVSRELLSLKTILELLSDDAQREIQFSERLVGQISEILANCTEVLKQIDSVLQEHSRSRLKEGLKWTLGGRDHMNKLRSNLEAHKSALNIALDMISLIVTREIKAETKEIKANTEEIKAETVEIKADTEEIKSNSISIKNDTFQILSEITQLSASLSRNTLHSRAKSARRRSIDGRTVSFGRILEEENYDYDGLNAKNPHTFTKHSNLSLSRSASTMGSGLLQSNITAGHYIGDKDSLEFRILDDDPYPHWNILGWFSKRLVVTGFCPDIAIQSGSANTLDSMMESDENIELRRIQQLTIYTRPKPFAEGEFRVASYARTAASTSPFVIKSFKESAKPVEHIIEDMRIQALCKAFALEFNRVLETKDPIDFIVTACLQEESVSKSSLDENWLSLEPYITGDFIKYNSNNSYVRKEDSPDDIFNQTAQAFSHFTFERSQGRFLVVDLQGVGLLFTDPAIQTRDPERFKLAETNLNIDGFMFFFATHECNAICWKLRLKSGKDYFLKGNFDFRTNWSTIQPSLYCSNNLCQRIMVSQQESRKFPGYSWCNACLPQLESSMIQHDCISDWLTHKFQVSRFFYESQGESMPRRCPKHF